MVKILIIGSSGFVGSNVKRVLATSYEVVGASRSGGNVAGDCEIDLLDKSSITTVINKTKPNVIINCAGVVDNSDLAAQNPIFTSNLLTAVINSKINIDRIIISGSAAEYGLVNADNIPVNEEAPLNATAGYGISKLKESQIALEFAKKYRLPIVIARIFNPIGVGMHTRFLIPKLIQQIVEIQEGKRDNIEVSRLDSRRDYVNINDVATALKAIIEHDPQESVYNIGSGKSTSNGELVELILKNSKLTSRPKIIETQAEPEPLVAIQADITKITSEFGWKPENTIEQTVKEIIHASRR
jgi:GDP-4-dehydro-6-deoxy-D-mannose reductase